jgi:hypothetical protein
MTGPAQTPPRRLTMRQGRRPILLAHHPPHANGISGRAPPGHSRQRGILRNIDDGARVIVVAPRLRPRPSIKL